MNVFNDQFYTKISIAKKCLIKIPNLHIYSSIIEPSAGTGSFTQNLKNVFAYDLDPKINSIKKQDFLLLKQNKQWGNKILFVGNPPFGKRSTLAKKFIKKAIKLNASTIAFILPDTFNKSSNQKYSLWPKEWSLIKTYRLPKKSFYILNNTKRKSYHVPCTFFIWTKDASLRSRYKNLRTYPPKFVPKEFCFLPRGSKDADFVINGNSGKIKEVYKVTNPKSEHYIKIINRSKNQIKSIIDKFKNLHYKNLSSVNGGNYWINQEEIINAWIQVNK